MPKTNTITINGAVVNSLTIAITDIATGDGTLQATYTVVEATPIGTGNTHSLILHPNETAVGTVNLTMSGANPPGRTIVLVLNQIFANEGLTQGTDHIYSPQGVQVG